MLNSPFIEAKPGLHYVYNAAQNVLLYVEILAV